MSGLFSGLGSRSAQATREEAYVEYVAASRLRLRRIAYALCGDWDQADDLLQIALTKLYLAWPRVHRDGRETAYVRQILVRTNIDEHRRSQRRPQQTGLDAAEQVPARADVDPAERSELVQALQRLPLMQRRVVVLRHWLELSVAEAAAELGISEGTVKSHTSRGLAALQRDLGKRRLEESATP